MKKEYSDAEKLKRALAGDAMTIGILVNAVKNKFGDDSLPMLKDAVQEGYSKLALKFIKAAGARFGDGDMSDWIKTESFVSKMLAMEFTTEYTANRGVIKVQYCPLADSFRNACPECCQKVIIGFERAIAGKINKRMQVHGEAYIPLGDDHCEIVCELK